MLLVVAVISLATQPANQAPPQWSVSGQPVLTLGARDGQGPELFGTLAGAIRLNSGVIVVGDRSTSELKFFSPGGKFLRSSGRKGEGPGEFRNMDPIMTCGGDSILVYDRALYRLSVFTPEGSFVRSGDIGKWSKNGLPPYDLWCGRSGAMGVVHRSTEPPKAEGPFRQSMEITLVRGDSSVSLGFFPSSERYFFNMQAFPRHLGKETTVALGARTVYVGTADSFQVSAYSMGGKRLSDVHDEMPPPEVTSVQIDEYIRALIAARRRPDRDNAYAGFLRGLQWPTRYPAYGRLIVDASDNLWVQEYPVPGALRQRWRVYAPAGTRIAVVTVPGRFQLLQAGSDFVLGSWRDEDDVEYVRLYRLSR